MNPIILKGIISQTHFQPLIISIKWFTYKLKTFLYFFTTQFSKNQYYKTHLFVKKQGSKRGLSVHLFDSFLFKLSLYFSPVSYFLSLWFFNFSFSYWVLIWPPFKILSAYLVRILIIDFLIVRDKVSPTCERRIQKWRLK